MRIKLKVFSATSKTKEGKSFPTWFCYDNNDKRYSVRASKASGVALPTSYNFTISLSPKGIYSKTDDNGYNILYITTPDVIIEKMESTDNHLEEKFDRDIEREIEEEF